MPYVVIGALIVGFTLGLMGSGGSILTVPILTYLLGHDGKVAIAESLAIVGSIAAVTMLPYARAKSVSWRSVLFFGVPGMTGTYLGAWLSRFVSSPLQLTLFAVVMLSAAAAMLRRDAKASAKSGGAAAPNTPDPIADRVPRTAAWIIVAQGIVVGIVTGLVGVGGGFLIVPALVIVCRLPMRVAVGTSLAVVTLNSVSGFWKYVGVLASIGQSVNWGTVGTFVLIGIVGSVAGHFLATRMNQRVLRRVFAVFLIGMGLFVLGMEGPKLFAGGKSAADAIQITPPCKASEYLRSPNWARARQVANRAIEMDGDNAAAFRQ